MIVGPRYNDSDPAVEAAYQRAAEAETAMSGEPECGFPEGCCEHQDMEHGHCWDCSAGAHGRRAKAPTPRAGPWTSPQARSVTPSPR